MKKERHPLIYIIGGSSGIGLASAELWLRQGARVAIFGRNPVKLQWAEEYLLREHSHFPAGSSTSPTPPHQPNTSTSPHSNSPIAIYSLDVTDVESTNTTLQQAMEDVGVPNLLFIASGIAKPGYFQEISQENFKETLETNLHGTWNVLSTVVPAMQRRSCTKESKDTLFHIVTCSSIAGFIGTFGYTAYSASKFGIIGISEALRGELKPYGISVSVLCPPDTDTPGFHKENQTKPPETLAISGNIKVVTPEYVAKRLLQGVARKKFMIIPGPMGKLSFFLKSYTPRLLHYLMDRSVSTLHKKNHTKQKTQKEHNNNE